MEELKERRERCMHYQGMWWEFTFLLWVESLCISFDPSTHSGQEQLGIQRVESCHLEATRWNSVKRGDISILHRDKETGTEKAS